jgi:Cd2+/Zn2+-exporting ATPase
MLLMGIATMWAAVFGDVGVSFIAILNAMRATRKVKAK